MSPRFSLPALAIASCAFSVAQAQPALPPPAEAASAVPLTLPPVTVRASADASAAGLQPAYPGGQVARGGRVGILGSQDLMSTPFSLTAYTNELIQDRQARSVGDVLQNDATVRMARGFGNFQESYFIRGFILGSDNVAYNGLYSLLPRQYIATELFERVELVRGATAFLNGASPGGDGIGGAINLVPKRATNEPLTRVTAGWSSGGQTAVSTDISRRFGPDNAAGVRFNASHHSGGSAVDDEHSKLDLLALGLDWHSRDVRLSADLGWQENRLRGTRPNVSLATTAVPSAPDAASNFAQPWSYSNERDLFGTFRGEVDLAPAITAWAAYGLRRSSEANSLANPTVSDAATGAASTYRFDNTRRDHVDTGELGIRGKLRTGPVSHQWVASFAAFQLRTENAYGFDFGNQLPTNIYDPVPYPQPAFTASAGFGGSLDEPRLTTRTKLTSVAIGDTLGLLDDRLLLTLGLRRQALDIANYAYGTAALYANYDKSRVSPSVGALYKLGQQLSVYGNYIEGLTQGDTAAGAFGAPPPVNQGEVLPPYVSKQEEVGIKYDGGTLGGSLALFSTRKPRSYVNAANVFVASGEDRHRGAELSLFGIAAKGVRVLGGLTWLDAEQQSTGSTATDGKRVIGVPKTQANLGVEWDVPGLTGLAVDGRVVYTGGTYADAPNTLNVPSWTRLDLGARYGFDLQGRLVTLRARVDNVANRSYWSSVGGYPGAGYLVLGAPRSVSLSASVDF